MRILLIRHASTDLLGRMLYGRMPGVHLSAEGCRQAQALADALRSRYRIDELVSSPLERTQQTARFLADAYGIGVSLDDGVNEIDFGAWMGKPFPELIDSIEWKQYNESRDTARPPEGEFLMQVQARAWASVQRIVARHQDTDDATAAVISHGDVIRAMLVLLLGMPLDHIHRLEAAPASVSEILIEQGNVRVLRINQVF
ncbi:MAG: histidine phosphatase family protein [Acidobacteriaceae bacterium]|nr:histidine phosphatase family protein [Acidobacteriaceae bacterium]